MKTVFRLFDNGERHARRGSRREIDEERERERGGKEEGGGTWHDGPIFTKVNVVSIAVVRVTSNLRVTWNRFPDAMSVARSLHGQTWAEGGGETHAPMHLTSE